MDLFYRFQGHPISGIFALNVTSASFMVKHCILYRSDSMKIHSVITSPSKGYKTLWNPVHQIGKFLLGGNGTSQIHSLPPTVGFTGFSIPPLVGRKTQWIPPLVGFHWVFHPTNGGKEWFYNVPFPPSKNYLSLFIVDHFYRKYNVIERKRVRRDCVFLGLAGLPLGISLGLRPASPWKTQSLPPLFLSIYQLYY